MASKAKAEGYEADRVAGDLKKSALSEANEAIDRAEAMPYAPPASPYDTAYADGRQPWR